MSGFKTSSLNSVLKKNCYEQIIFLVNSCCILMVQAGVKVENHEEKITAHLTEKYLNDFKVRNTICSNQIPVKFINESVEKFDLNKNTYVGRVDIKAVSSNWLSCKNNNDYYTIECKRINGKADLNKKYIKEGVSRFVISPIKYQSYHNKNIMLGYVVKTIDIISNIQKIDAIHKKELTTHIIKDIIYIPESANANFYMCESEYILTTGKLTLNHIFYDFSSIIV